MDKIPTKQIFKELNLPIVNQINAQIKLLDVWRSLKWEPHPTQWARRNDTNQERRTRAAEVNQLKEAYGGKILASTFVKDAAKLWNKAPYCINFSDPIYSVKKNIRNYICTLPI